MNSNEAWPGFEEFFRDNREAFMRVARRNADAHTAEDAVQAALTQMLQRWEKLTSCDGSLAAYGRRAVKNATVDQHRKNKKTVPMPHSELPNPGSDIGLPDAAYEAVRSEI
ncbi:RNA polymerase sigma factor [Streptomyces smyrnaeus]|uniref:RNA polymerase sigma factor n=1 Tax=Streptomyces smyrnaeus TaxID=1387713 RepID=UPI00379F21CB